MFHEVATWALAKRRLSDEHSWWRVSTQILVALLIGWKKIPANQKHYQDLGRDASTVWNFCARYSDVVLRGLKWRPRETSAVLSGYHVPTFLLAQHFLMQNPSFSDAITHFQGQNHSFSDAKSLIFRRKITHFQAQNSLFSDALSLIFRGTITHFQVQNPLFSAAKALIFRGRIPHFQAQNSLLSDAKSLISRPKITYFQMQNRSFSDAKSLTFRRKPIHFQV